MSEYAEFTKLSEYHNGEEWPYGEAEIVWAVSGELARRIRAAAGACEDAVVVLAEHQSDGGWSEYTQETDYSFDLRVGGLEVDLGAGAAGVESLDWCGLTAIGRLDAWLKERGQ